MNDYEAKQEARRERLERAADAARAESDSRFNRARDAVAGIPLGQPILVGHHSEKRHRAALARQDSNMRKAIDADDRAKELARRAEGVGTGGISSDDPEAVAKLEDKRTDLERARDEMKRINAHYKKHKTLDGMEPPIDPNDRKAAEGNLRAWHGVYSAPFPSYALSNIGARIRDAAKRSAHLERKAVEAEAAGGEPIVHTIAEGYVVTEDLDDNRVLLQFPARLSKEHYKQVRSWGFVWSPTRDAFVRKHSGGAVQWAKQLATKIAADLAPKEA